MKLRSVAHRLQDRFLGSLGRGPDDRTVIVRTMLQPRNGDAAGYWLQLVIAAMLATLGLALNSTAVVIGAMLVAPLMRPLVELAMGLASGAAGLVLRAAVRTVASICVVTLVALAITWLLPFHEITSELESRTAPSLLDLAVAGACALAAAYATLRGDADIATTAAGTSIGISLVPPLCAAGYGLAIGDDAIWRGAALLFTANLSGILVIATTVFALSGFSQVDIRSVEHTIELTGKEGVSLRLGRTWSSVTAARLGPLARIVPPLVLLAIVYLPLQRAVGEIRHRNEIRQTVAVLLAADKQKVVQYALDQTATGVALRVVVLGDAKVAGELEKELRIRLAGLAVDNPKISVWAVPDAASVTALATRVDAIPPPIVPEPAPQTARRHSSDVAGAIRAAWPRSGTGELLAVWHDLDRPQRVRVIHLGAPLGPAGIELLARSVLVDQLEIEEDALLPVEAPRAEGLRWVSQALDLITRSRHVPGIHLCVFAPGDRGVPGRPDPSAAEARVILSALVGASQSPTVGGEIWRIVPQREPCTPVETK